MSSTFFHLDVIKIVCDSHSMVKPINPRIAVNLTKSDDALLKKAKAAFEKRTGVTIPTTETIRLAIKALATAEGV